MTVPPEFEPRTVYRKGEQVSDTRMAEYDTEPGGIFEALHDLRSGLLPPRYVAIDCPGKFWKRVEAAA